MTWVQFIYLLSLLPFVFYPYATTYILLLFKHFVAYNTLKNWHTHKNNTKDILQVLKGWYSATTYITPNPYI